jgi:hypothetical protein
MIHQIMNHQIRPTLTTSIATIFLVAAALPRRGPHRRPSICLKTMPKQISRTLSAKLENRLQTAQTATRNNPSVCLKTMPKQISRTLSAKFVTRCPLCSRPARRGVHTPLEGSKRCD